MLLQMPDFALHVPGSLAEASSLLCRYGEDARILAGGTDLLVKMKHRRVLPPNLINIKSMTGLGTIAAEADGVEIGALATMQAIRESPLVARRFPLLWAAAGRLGTPQIRNLATLGGNLANASPSAETAAVLLAYEATVHCFGPVGERHIPLEEFFVGPGRSTLGKGEIITGIHLPAVPTTSAGTYRKYSLRPMDIAIAAVAVLVGRAAKDVAEVRIALGSVAPTPLRARKAEAFLGGRPFAAQAFLSEALDEAARIAAEETAPIDDLRGSKDFRRRIVRTLVRDGLQQSVAQIWH